MTETEEALAAMAKAEEAWNKMVDETVRAAGEFIKEFQAAFPYAPAQHPRLLP
jgi:hypothetical protein